jgi:cell division protein ZapE
LGQQLGDTPNSLLTRKPEVSKTELIRQLQPPPEFAKSRVTNYIPDPRFPSQAEAVKLVKAFAGSEKPKLFSKKVTAPGIYLDGGFGVGKTHLLASIWHDFPGKKVFGSFLDYTSLVGYLGFAAAVDELSKFGLVCIDEFELDDPGDTMIMSRLLKELEAKGVRFAATSNTPPNALGAGRFAAADFQREIQGLGSRFQMISVDGEDYRHREIDGHSQNLSVEELAAWLSGFGKGFGNDFWELLAHLGKLHPTHFRALLSDVDALALWNVSGLVDQVDALRLVAFIDRLYEQKIPLRTNGVLPITDIFPAVMLEGAYRKKYLRAVSRMSALCLLS